MSKELTDVVPTINALPYDAAGELIVPRHHREPVQLGHDLWIGPLGVVADVILDACEPRGAGQYLTPIRQFHAACGLYRVNAPPGGGEHDFDPDRRLAAAMALSRLVRPTTVDYYYAARLVGPLTAPTTINPAQMSGPGARAYVVDEDANWLRDADVTALRGLLEAFRPEALPARVTRAMWYAEYAAQTPMVDVRWTLVVTELEALVHTDERGRHGRNLGSTRQFVQRLLGLGLKVSALGAALNFDEATLRDVYERRSGLAHGAGFGERGFDAAATALYERTEAALRAIIAAAILDPNVAAQFADTDSIRSLAV